MRHDRTLTGLAVVAAFAAAAMSTRYVLAARSSKRGASATAPSRVDKNPGADSPRCPIQPGEEWSEAQDQKEAIRYRRALIDGIFNQWVELGRGPTPTEFARRMKLSQPEADRLLDEMQACGESVESGILRVPISENDASKSELIAVAWPLANVPTGIVVTVEGGRPVFGRCAIDALGVSEMLGKKAIVEATARDNGMPLRVVVSGHRIESAEPAGIVIVKGKGCDNMQFFSSKEAAERWRQEHGGEGTLFSLAAAVKLGAEIFGSYSAGLL